ncbi:MAG: hypothetical protein ABIP21_01725 [Acidimicrobiia bacterium]
MTDSDLPFIDEHAIEIEASTTVVWEMLVRHVGGLFGGSVAPRYARVVGCDDQIVGGPQPLAEGSTLPGFHVVIFTPPAELVLAGRHRFSTYVLRFQTEAISPTRSRLHAETRAAFPGVAGRMYRLAVIGTGGHAVVVRRVLSRVKRSTLHDRSTANR